MTTTEQLNTIQGISKYRYKKTPNLQTGISYVESIFKETNRLPDSYFFWVDKEGLVDPDTNEYLHNLITPDSHEESSYLGLVEYSALWQLDRWSIKEESQLSVWISPELKKEGLYDENKIVLHETSVTPAGQKKLNNIMIIFECSRDQCLKLAKQLFPKQTEKINTPEELRCALLDIGTDLSIAEIIHVLSPYIPKGDKVKLLSEDHKTYLGGLIARGAPSYFFAQEMMRLGAIGEHSLVCVGGGSGYINTLQSNSIIIGGSEKFVKNCGVCGTPINAFISSGYRCSQCKEIYLGC